MASNKNKYESVGQLHYRSELDDKKAPARTYKPGQLIDEDLDDAEAERLLKKGAIREAKLAAQERAARERAAEAARAAAEAHAAAQAEVNAVNAAAAAAGGDDGLGDAAPATVKPSGNKPARKGN